ncbi:extracellular solute-binding protein [Streptomyces sp. BE20]|uniref:ABC transporter substrate-binding protein n=1 Tax=Streptomyces sp. BE20 TaxID=3002525 RepID=UPI002E768E0D|nr:extracellular solute-binding protein [Streptomyces sp. BE20]MEE1820851.1 extracellular solute-binding protein [Streptomyces sp. BE20]
MRRAIRRAAGAAVLGLVMLAGCSTGAANTDGSAAGGDVGMSLLTFETPNLTAAYWDDAIARTNAKVPGVKIEKLVAPSAEQRNEYARQLDSTGSLPDIMVAVDPAGMAQVGKLAEFSKGELPEWTDPTANSFNGKIYQLPTNAQTWQVYYQKAAFAEAGITSTPATWDELQVAVGKLKAAGTTPFVIGGGAPDGLGPRWTFSQLVATEVYAKDPQWLGKLVAGKTDFSDPLFVSAASRMKELAGKENVDHLSATYAEAQSDFLAGKGAMYPMGSWFSTAPDDTLQDQIGIFTMPTKDGSLVMPAYTGGGLSVSAKADDVAKAKRWAIEFSKLNADGGARYDGLFVALKDYKPPTDLPPLYSVGLDLYEKGRSSGKVTPNFGNEGGIPALPSGFMAQVDAGLIDLLNGRSDVPEFVDTLNAAFKELSG